ncbi:taste receptor type 2 member 19-like [Dipodomys merriami]|uniref:taste receptor type 2 member 19-like n=1 Tax=Dipodomys merriami TaxID=94247 RepID=UPI003855C3AB
MTSFLQIVSGIAVVEFVLGNFANVFVALVNAVDWVKRRRVSSVDGILMALAVSRLGLLWVIMLSGQFTVFNPAFPRGKSRLALAVAYVTTNHFSSWNGTALIIFYFLKIASFSNLTFLHLKRRVQSIVVLVVCGTLVFLFPNIVMLHMGWIMQVGDCEGNATWKMELRGTIDLSTAALFSLLNLIPFVTSLVCILLLIYSLCRHLRRMRLHVECSRDASVAVHVKALQMMVSFLLLFTLNSLTIIASSWTSSIPQNMWTEPLFHMVGLLYPSSHSYILIWGNKKLKRAFLLVLGQCQRLRQGGESTCAGTTAQPQATESEVALL